MTTKTHTHMIKWGISAGTHDASLAVVEGDDILFASNSERYSGVKNDPDLCEALINDALEYGQPDIIYWYENPYKKALRKIYAGQSNVWLSPKKYLKGYGVTGKVVYGNHHESHAAAGFATSEFESAAVLVIDAIGEFTTTSIWSYASDTWGKNLYKKRYPYSLGLFYSAITARVGLKPNEDEYILMGMAAYGNPIYVDEMREIFHGGYNFHKGCKKLLPEANHFDLACSAQHVYEEEFIKLLHKTKELTLDDNLVIMGGCALNCLANSHAQKLFKNVWIMPNPSDSGSSLGAISAGERKKLNWKTPYLGKNIDGDYPVEEAIDELSLNKIVGIANGRAEFGPRALGNRSLLADPTGEEMKDLVNQIKKRQEFRPFAPVILQSEVHNYFHVDEGFESPYMQYVVRVKDPLKFSAITHHDGTSRVQTVTREQHEGLWELLTMWQERTGIPMLLNTSLNIKGCPIANTKADAELFESVYGIKIV